ncbi:F1F0 ATP synthase subunit g [Rhodotorula paludigena]|uniref:Mitochondrial F1F0-ATP synthase g subunit n=1 Tax=Rhodotorula paludigena TaxID=86838 RepID=A0AAV5G4H2_9BASI|nr:hypothetical protein Rhopal_000310-T1 [Rhodotorula paludigena]
MRFQSARSAFRGAFSPAQVRNASTESAAHKAQAAAASAQATASKALSGVSSTVGNLLGAYREPVFYNAAVAKEIAKQVYVAEKLAPPSFAQVSYTFRQFLQQAPHLSFWHKLYETGAWKTWALYAVEAYGVFSIGEMIGRRHVVGYKLDESRYHALT